MNNNLTKDLIDKIGEDVNGQIQKLIPEGLPVQVVLFNTPDFTIQTTKNRTHMLTLRNFTELKDIETPDWLKIKS